MKKIKEFLNPNLSNDEIDLMMEKLLTEKFENQKRIEYSKILENEYGITRKGDIKTLKKPSRLKWFLFALFLAVGLGSLYKMMISENAPAPQEEQLFAYLESKPLEMYEGSRGDDTNVNTLRAKAIQAYGNKDYAQAVQFYSELKDLIKEDKFYQSYALLRTKKFAEARIGFQDFASNLKEGDQYYPETQLYIILSYLGEKNKIQANNLYDNLVEGSWEKNELKMFFD